MRTCSGFILIGAVCGLCLAAHTLFAQGTAFTYQGQLTDSSAAANGSYDLQFTLYDAGGGGNVVAGPLTNTAVAVSNGLFLVRLDFGSAFTGSARWLEIGRTIYSSARGLLGQATRRPKATVQALARTS